MPHLSELHARGRHPKAPHLAVPSEAVLPPTGADHRNIDVGIGYPLLSDSFGVRDTDFETGTKCSSLNRSSEIRLSDCQWNQIESIVRRAWSGVGVELESRWNLEFDRLKRRVATITWDWIPILDGGGYPFWLRVAFS